MLAEQDPKLDKDVHGWEVWSEGYAATGEAGGAILLGTFPGKTFAEAIERWIVGYASNPKLVRRNINGDPISYWGCRFYDNEQDARRSFG